MVTNDPDKVTNHGVFNTFAKEAQKLTSIDPAHNDAQTVFTAEIDNPSLIPRKRRKLSASRHNSESSDEADQLLDTTYGLRLAESSGKGQGKQRFDGLRLPALLSPKSAYQGNVPALPISKEKDVLEDILVRSRCRYLKTYHRKVNRITGRGEHGGREVQ